MIGTTAALVIAGLSAGSKVASSAIQAHGAKSAAKTQMGAADRAAAVQEDATRRSEARMQPFVEGGTNAYKQLGDLLGVTQPAAKSPLSDPGWGAPTPVPGGGTSRTWQGPGPNPMFQPGTPGYAAQNPGAPQPPAAGGSAPPPEVQQPPSQTSSGYVRIAWPGGVEDSVPQDHVAQYQTLGATLAR